MSIFFTADNHFGHTNIVERFNRGQGLFTSINHHDSVLRQKWCETVTDEDEVYLLGDIALGDLEQTLLNFKQLPGKKKLIPGNHDAIFSRNSANYIAKHYPLYVAAGLEILPENTSMMIADVEVLLSHFPYETNDLEGTKDRWSQNRPVFEHKPLLHGHTHFTARFNPNNQWEFHVGVDANNFTPVPLSEVEQWVKTLPRIS